MNLTGNGTHVNNCFFSKQGRLVYRYLLAFFLATSIPAKQSDYPQIINYYINGLSKSTAMINWQTNVPVYSSLTFGLTTAYGDTLLAGSESDTLFHLELDSLQAQTTYYYKIIIHDSLGQKYPGVARQFSTPQTNLLQFSNITAEAGTGGPWQYKKTGGHAASFADADGDSLPDLYITMAFLTPRQDLFFHNLDGKKFDEESAARGIDDLDGGSHGAVFIDIDNDGDYDLFNGTTDPADSISGRNNLYLNDGNGYFSEISDSVGLPDIFFETRGLTALDYDSDGDLDLVTVSGYLGDEDPDSDRNEFYHNNLMETGQLQFVAIDTSLFNFARIGQGITDTDWDGDGDIDLIAANRTGEVRFFRNENAVFTAVDAAGLGFSDADSARDGVTTADIDNDGDLDLLFSGDDYGRLYRNAGFGQYVFLQQFAGTDGYMGNFADLDNDADLDLVFAGDTLCYLNDGSGYFTPGAVIPVDAAKDPRALAFADIDRDGDLDFAVACKRSKNQLIRNDLNSGNWLKVDLKSRYGQAGGRGAKVSIFSAGDNKRLGFQEAVNVRGYLGQNESLLHFGLATNTVVDVEVKFIDGSIARRNNVAANQVLVIAGPDADTADPLIYRVHFSEIGQTRAWVHFNTNEDALVQINYDTTEALTHQQQKYQAGRVHNFLLDNLQPGHEYLFRIQAHDAVGNLNIKYSSFKTAAPVPKYGIFEKTVTPASDAGSFYLSQPEITFVFSGKSGAALNEIVEISAFWDGDSTFRVRFSPQQTGVWQWQVQSADMTLSVLSGEFVCAGKLPDEHISKYGFVRISPENPMILANERPFFLLGDTQWSFSTDALSEQDFRRYVEVRAEQGFNYIHGVAYQLFPPGNDKNEGGQAFFQNHADSLNPAFWREFDQRIAYLNEKGIVAGFMFAWGDGGWQVFQTRQQAERFTRYLVRRYGAYNVFWIVAGEYEEADVVGGYGNIAGVIAASDPYAHPITIHTVHSSADSLDLLPWQSLIYQQTTDPALVAVDRPHGKPVVNSEFGYEGYQSADSVRIDAWQIVMRGGFPVYGNYETYHYFAQMSDANLYSAGSKFMQYLGEFFAAAAVQDFNWWQTSRFDSLGPDLYRAMISSEKSIYYSEIGQAFDLPLPDFGKYWLHQYWFDTRTGQWQVEDSVVVNTAPHLEPPDSAYAGFFRLVDVASTGIGESATKPTVFAVSQNYPNPFANSTQIQIAIPVQGELRVQIYDTRGRQVKELFKKSVTAGVIKLLWHGRNSRGYKVANGLYILQAQFQANSGVKKIIAKRLLHLR